MKLSILTFFLLLVSTSFGQPINKKDAQKRKQGPWEVFYENSSLHRYKGQFKDGKPYGIFTYYYESGRIQAKVNYLSGGNITRSQVYHETSGHIKAYGKYINQKKDSIWTYFDNVGNVKSKEKYINGNLEGQRVVYYEPINGKYIVARYEYYKNNVLDGIYKEYHQNTKLKSEGEYRDGHLNGDVKFYYTNGKMERLERYKYAVKHGWWIFFNDDGTQVGTRLYWEGRVLKGEELEKKKAELKAQRK